MRLQHHPEHHDDTINIDVGFRGGVIGLLSKGRFLDLGQLSGRQRTGLSGPRPTPGIHYRADQRQPAEGRHDRDQGSCRSGPTDLTAVAAAGKQDYQPQVTALQSALQQLETTVSALGNGSASGSLTAVVTAIAATGTAAVDLFTQLKTACGS